MANEALLEQRLSAVEAADAQLQRRLPLSVADWIEQITGTFKDEPAFEEVIAYGRAFRAADHPPADDAP
jgi:hypothetical protein